MTLVGQVLVSLLLAGVLVTGGLANVAATQCHARPLLLVVAWSAYLVATVAAGAALVDLWT